MNRLLMSRAASGLLRAILDRAGADSDRILLTGIRSTDWRSLTLEGERHVIGLRLPGPLPVDLLHALTGGIEDAEFVIPGQIVADIGVAGVPLTALDGSLSVTIEALTIAE
jgi:hypothetical protein